MRYSQDQNQNTETMNSEGNTLRRGDQLGNKTLVETNSPESEQLSGEVDTANLTE